MTRQDLGSPSQSPSRSSPRQYRMSRSLADLPTEILAQVTCGLYPEDFHRLAYLVGNSQLKRRLDAQGGTKELVYRAYSCKAPWQPERFIFPSTLTRLSLQLSQTEKSIGWIENLPPTMLEIEIDSAHSTAPFVRPVRDSDPAEELPLYSSHGFMLVNMSQLFPQLRSFTVSMWQQFFSVPPNSEPSCFTELVVTERSGAYSSDPQICPISAEMNFHFLRNFPPTISKLSLSSILWFALFALKTCSRHMLGFDKPPPLASALPCLSTVESLYFTSLISYPDFSSLPNLLALKGEISAPNGRDLQRNLPKQLQTLTLGARPVYPPDSLLYSPSPSTADDGLDFAWETEIDVLPASLTELNVYQWYYPLHKHIRLLPTTLRRLHIPNYIVSWTPEDLQRYLPRNLTSLELAMDYDFIPYLPKKLTHLKVKCDVPWTEERFNMLPPSLTSLIIAQTTPLIGNQDLQFIPRTLKKLTIPTSTTLSVKCFEYLPTTLRELHLPVSVAFSDRDIASAPRHLERFTVATMAVTGHFFPPQMDTFNLESLMASASKVLPALSAGDARTADMFAANVIVSGLTHEIPGRALSLPAVNLPRSVTDVDATRIGNLALQSLAVDCLKTLRTKQIEACMELPFLHQIETFILDSPYDPYTQFVHNFMERATSLRRAVLHGVTLRPTHFGVFPTLPPTLTSLTIDGILEIPEAMSTHPNLTELSLLKATMYQPLKPSNLPPNLTSFKAKNAYYATWLACTTDPFPPKITHLDIAAYLRYESIEQFNLPPALTTLIAPYVSFPASPAVIAQLPSDLKSLRDPKDALAFFRGSLLPNLQHIELATGQTEGLVIRWDATTLHTMPRSLKHAHFDQAPGFGITKCRSFTHLPSQLTSLNLLTHVPHNVTRHLPRSLTSLAIWGTTMNETSYKLLPRSLVHLSLIQLRKFLPKYARALPEGLLELHIDCPRLSGRGLAALPRGLREFSFTRDCNIAFPDYLLLPPKLRLLRLPMLQSFATYRTEHFPPGTGMIISHLYQTLNLGYDNAIVTS